MPPDLALKRKRGTVLAAMNDLASKAGVSRARMYVWLKTVFKSQEIKVGSMTDEECDKALDAMVQELSNGFSSLMDGVKPLHHRNSLAGSVHPASLYVPKTRPPFVVVTFSLRRWEVEVENGNAPMPEGVSSCLIAFRGENDAMVSLSEEGETVALIPKGRMWKHSS